MESNEIKCPNCGVIFKVDESYYAAIVRQVHDKEFNEELEKRIRELQESSESKNKLQITQLEKMHTDELADISRKLSEKDNTINDLEGQIKRKNSEKDIAVIKALEEEREKQNKELADRNRKITELETQLKVKDSEKELEISKLRAEFDGQLKNKDKEKELSVFNAVSGKEAEIIKLRGELEANASKKEIEIQNAVSKKDIEISEKERAITELEGKLANKDNEIALKEKSITEKYVLELKLKDDQIDQLRDFRAKQSTKMIGESLEQHCQYIFNKNRAMAFPKAYFEKDNDIRTGSKGDFIFRENTEDNIELLSIMFEMKNESETTATKHKNEDFFKELDKDRHEKNCEYAVLVSLLEPENDLYNDGIVDVSYKYPKMYVVRPQFFLAIISFLRNAALSSLEYRRKYEKISSQQIDVNNFEKEMNDFKKGFGQNFKWAKDRFDEAIEEIDKSITHLNKIKQALTTSCTQLQRANDKVEDLSIKKLTQNAPSVRKMFDEARLGEPVIHEAEAEEK